MNPPCARCNKTVYPVEKLNCLDKYWHKGCFNCEVCHLTLSMKTYKGYNKSPYCQVHYPQTKFTAVAETPENARLAKNTANQSAVVYQKAFVQDKGKFTAVADDPESLRLKKNQKNASMVSYHEGPVAGNFVPAEAAGRVETQAAPQATAPGAPQPVAEQAAAPAAGGPRYVAVYDYTAADDDEVSFSEGDAIINAQSIDDGWMTGTVERTGKAGMLPSNYVELQS